MTDVYDRFDKTTRDVQAAALLCEGKAVGRIVIRLGSSALAYVQIWGAPMRIGRATGFGYDKATAAIGNAVARMSLDDLHEDMQEEREAMTRLSAAFSPSLDDLTWANRLRRMGFDVAMVM